MNMRLRELHPYCLGFGLFWSMPLLILFGVMGLTAPSSDWLLFVKCKEIALVACLPLAALASTRLAGALRKGLPFAMGALLSIVGYLYVHCFVDGNSSPALSVVAGIALGLSSAAFYLSWHIIYANEGQAMTAIYLPFAALLAFGISVLMFVLPHVVSEMCMVAFIPAAATYTLWRSSCDMDPFVSRPLRPFLPVVMSDTWKPVLCASVICFVRSLVGHLPALYGSDIVTSMILGLGIAALVAVAVGLWSANSVGARDIFQVIIPLICVVLFVPALFGEKWLAFLMGTLGFGSHLMLILTLILCARYAASTQLAPVSVFMLCGFPVLAFSLLGNLIGFAAARSLGSQMAQMASSIEIPGICFIVCFVVLVVVSLGKRPRSLAEPADDTLLINPPSAAPESVEATEEPRDIEEPDLPEESLRVVQRAQECGLSAREVEVMSLLLKGNTTSAISRKLFISENTTRGHMKRIYRKLDVHSRQELIDLFESEGE